MKLHSMRIQGLRVHYDVEVKFGASTFLIGPNNIGKSTILKALEYLLNDVKKIDSSEEFFSVLNEENVNERLTDEIILTAEFRDCPEEAKEWKGLKGRVFTYDTSNCPEESGYTIFYKKTFKMGSNVKIEMKQVKREIKDCFLECKTLNDYIREGISQELIEEEFEGVDKEKKVTPTQKKKIETFDDLYDLDESGEEEWFLNPGGIPGVVLSRLPSFLLIPAQDKIDELSGNSGALLKTLNSLFEDVRNASKHFHQAQLHLSLLEKELDPTDETKEFGKMMGSLNNILEGVFPNTKLHASANLSDADKSIKPIFDVSMSNNVNTKIENQGTGVIRSAVFAMLRYRNLKANTHKRPLIIGFEEPEIYLHPNAAHQMRDTIYELANTVNNQIVCTTHSPFMIDLGRKSEQILNHFHTYESNVYHGGQNHHVYKTSSNPFNVSEAFRTLTDDDKTYVKMIVRMDDYMSKIFFVKDVLIVEGDTEDVVIRETLLRMPKEAQKDIHHNWHIVKARGKASIISLVKYLKAMGFNPYVMHDLDIGTKGAEIFNEPIKAEVDNQRLFPLKNCIEDYLGYNAPSSEKPYKAYKAISEEWGKQWEEVPVEWKSIVEKIFHQSFILVSGESWPAIETVDSYNKVVEPGSDESAASKREE